MPKELEVPARPEPNPWPVGPAHGQGVSIVVPTFREALNIRALAERVEGAMAASGLEWELVLVDDNSQDGIKQVVADLSCAERVRLKVRPGCPRDLSQSVLDGFEIAKFDRLVVMDADLSHPPEAIASLVRALEDGCEMAIGSRYTRGGTTAEGWAIWHRLNSQVATALVRPLAECSDPLSGFFAVDRRSLPLRSSLDPIGYKIALEIMVRGRLAVCEVPIHFADRRAGRSKTGWAERWRFLRHIARLYAFKHGGATGPARFVLFAGSAVLVDLGFYLGML